MRVIFVNGSPIFIKTYSIPFHCPKCGYVKRISCECDHCPKRLKCLGSEKPKCNPVFGNCVGCFLRSVRLHGLIKPPKSDMQKLIEAFIKEKNL